jgi:hypothetical protein
MSTRVPSISRIVAAAATLAVVAAACSSDQSSTDATTTIVADTTTSTTSPPDPAATSTIVPTTPTTTTADTTTTAAPTTTSTTTSTTTTTTIAPTTTTEPPLTAADLTLAFNGVLPFGFGSDDGGVIAGLTTALGAPNFDGAQTYPDPDGDWYVDATGEESYLHPVGRTVCFVNGLCTQFGGSTVDDLTFTGWEYTGEGTPPLATSDGITVDSVLSAFPGVVAIEEGGCYWVGYGNAAGVNVTLWSAGVPFIEVDGDGNWIINTPDLADVTVLSMSAGDTPYFLFDDC